LGGLAAGAFGIYQIVLFFRGLAAYDEGPATMAHRSHGIVGLGICFACFGYLYKMRNNKTVVQEKKPDAKASPIFRYFLILFGTAALIVGLIHLGAFINPPKDATEPPHVKWITASLAITFVCYKYAFVTSKKKP
jgi:uncharacterized membrane protein YidH (DUF202 family)